jgi:hemerythrin-like domain-containing protein
MEAGKPPQTSMRSSSNAGADFETSHRRILELCRDLEAFADALPNRLDPQRCRQLAKAMLPLLRRCHATEERLIGSIDVAELGRVEVSIRRLRTEHLRDQYFAEDIAEALSQISAARSPANPEALGFMMRSFFETQRRHIAFEQETLLPLLTSRAAH